MKAISLLQTENIIIADLDQTLSSTLSKLSSSHDAAFIFSKENKYMGMINPYYSIIKTSTPANAKVTSCIYHGPKVYTNFSIPKVARLMIESKIHYLPVFNEKEDFIGIVSARKLLARFEYLNIFTVKISELIKKKRQSLITVYEDDFISTALKLFKQYKLSKLLVINKQMRLRGILSYYDLISFLATPKKKDRFSKEKSTIGIANRRVKHFAKSFVLTLHTNDYVRDALHLILAKKIGSVVIVNDQNLPVNIITTKDLLSLLLHEGGKEKIEFTGKNLSKESKQMIGTYFDKLAFSLKKNEQYEKAKLIVKEKKTGGLFEVILSLFPKKGDPKHIHEEGKNLQKVLDEVKKKEK